MGVGGLCKGDSHPAPWLSDPTLTCFLPRAEELGEGFSDCCALLGAHYTGTDWKTGCLESCCCTIHGVPGTPPPPVSSDALGAPAECTGGDLRDSQDSASLTIRVDQMCIHQFMHFSQSEGSALKLTGKGRLMMCWGQQELFSLRAIVAPSP